MPDEEPKAKKKRTRRNYQKEAADALNRIGYALLVLKNGEMTERQQIAVNILEGKQP